jgi:hypothetical protein
MFSSELNTGLSLHQNGEEDLLFLDPKDGVYSDV